MATITVDCIHAAKERKGGFLARTLEKMTDAQMERARAIARPHLLTLSDEELQHIGYRREDVQRWPSGGGRWL